LPKKQTHHQKFPDCAKNLLFCGTADLTSSIGGSRTSDLGDMGMKALCLDGKLVGETPKDTMSSCRVSRTLLAVASGCRLSRRGLNQAPATFRPV